VEAGAVSGIVTAGALGVLVAAEVSVRTPVALDTVASTGGSESAAAISGRNI
jgi:hypothetical protein